MHNSQSDLAILRRLRVDLAPCKVTSVISVIWFKPSLEWIKINIGGAARQAPRLSGAGGVFQNHESKAIASSINSLGISFAFEAKLVVVIFVVSKVLSFDLTPIWIECDSLYVVRLLHSRCLDFFRSSKLIGKDVCIFLVNFKSTLVTFIGKAIRL
ncbi:conserved hypothetical protein [Ricinus communis]|uniref:RNase H type-1 domain-containing protein n=1 Tax=Ricinus communis TaxID=3988 RepID=B9T6M1_RICCO|nr:conserved hypothetical protein [Ricinus communis]